MAISNMLYIRDFSIAGLERQAACFGGIQLFKNLTWGLITVEIQY